MLNVSCCTTSQFDTAGGRRYRRHCGPTAAVNIIMTLRRQQGCRELQPDRIFVRCARSPAYFNMDFLHRFGGTSDLLAGFMLRHCLQVCGCHARVSAPHLLTGRCLTRALQRGSLLYIMLHRHPKYGSHHLVCYGMRRANGHMNLQCADGWTDRMTEIPFESIRFGWMYKVIPEK